ncbi:MAG: cyclic nucleotide-gated ion channel [Beijerinckiaceae bacterium]
MTQAAGPDDGGGPVKPAAAVSSPQARTSPKPSFRHQVYQWLDDGSSAPVAFFIHRLLIVLVFASVTAVVLETVPHLNARFGRLFDLIEFFAIGVFTVEYAARLWSAPEHKPYADLPEWKARWHFVRTPLAVIDLMAVLPFYASVVSGEGLRFLLVLRFLRFFKLARYSPGMQSLARAVYSERHALLACVFIVCGLVLVSGATMYMVEGKEQPDKLGTIPDGMYWAIITLTTVGYGDVVPITALGRIVASITALFGLAMVALPVAIIANAFSREIGKHDFVVTWSMVARVPLFANLKAADIAELMRYLQSQSYEPDEVIVRRGDPAHAMYFISSGEVAIDLPDQCVTLSEGHFFGEIAALRRTRRTATVRARSRTRLLVLDVADLRSLMDQKPALADSITSIARERLGRELLESDGDLISEELSDASPQTDPDPDVSKHPKV